MNWRRGIWRIWIVASAVWSIAVFQDPVWFGHWWEHGDPHPRDWLSLLLVVLFPWILTAVVLTGRWVVMGFRAEFWE